MTTRNVLQATRRCFNDVTIDRPFFSEARGPEVLSALRIEHLAVAELNLSPESLTRVASTPKLEAQPAAPDPSLLEFPVIIEVGWRI